MCRSKKTSKLRVAGLCVGNLPGTGEFPAQMASNAENVSIWWRHHDDRIRSSRTTFDHDYGWGVRSLFSAMLYWEIFMWYPGVWHDLKKSFLCPGIILGIGSANESRHSIVKSPFIGWAHGSRSMFVGIGNTVQGHYIYFSTGSLTWHELLNHKSNPCYNPCLLTLIFQYDFWLAGNCAAKQLDARFEKSLLINMDFNTKIS